MRRRKLFTLAAGASLARARPSLARARSPLVRADRPPARANTPLMRVSEVRSVCAPLPFSRLTDTVLGAEVGNRLSCVSWHYPFKLSGLGPDPATLYLGAWVLGIMVIRT